MQKQCPVCQQVREVEDFYYCVGKKKVSLRKKCIHCFRENRRKRQLEWLKKNREKVNKKQRENRKRRYHEDENFRKKVLSQEANRAARKRDQKLGPTPRSYDIFCKNVIERHERIKYERIGQSFFNQLSQDCPDLAKLLRKSKSDPFYDDSKLERARIFCKRRWSKFYLPIDKAN